MANMPVPDATGVHPQVRAVHARYSQFRAERGPMVTPDLTVVGANWGPSILPGHNIEIGTEQVGYRTLYSALTPDGTPAVGLIPGTYAITTGATWKG